jgi:hypothetical protein
MANATPFSYSPEPESWVRAEGGVREATPWTRVVGKLRMIWWRLSGQAS